MTIKHLALAVLLTGLPASAAQAAWIVEHDTTRKQCSMTASFAGGAHVVTVVAFEEGLFVGFHSKVWSVSPGNPRTTQVRIDDLYADWLDVDVGSRTSFRVLPGDPRAFLAALMRGASLSVGGEAEADRFSFALAGTSAAVPKLVDCIRKAFR